MNLKSGKNSMGNTGIDFYPFNVDFFNDDKIQLIEAEFGIKGSYIAVRLLCKIYNEGYYYQWGDDECLLFAKNIGNGIVPNIVSEVLTGLVRRSFFDKGVFDSFKVLTSQGIQNRYFKIVERRKRVDVRKEILLVDVSQYSNVNILGENANINNGNAIIPPQSKVKESKEDIIPPLPPKGGEWEEELIQKQEEIKNKEAELIAKEQELLKREAALKGQSTNQLPDISFVSDDFKEVFSYWLEYKRERRESYKSKKSLETCYKKLLELSNNTPDTARLIIEQSMASNWSGIFELRNGNTGKRAFCQTTADSTGEIICGETQGRANLQPGGASQEDYSARF